MEAQLIEAQRELARVREELSNQSQQQQLMLQQASNRFPRPSSHISVAKLTSKNYQSWKFQIRRVIASRDLQDVVYSPGNVLDPEYRYKDTTAQEILAGTLDNEVIPKVQSCNTAHEIWARLQSVYDQKGEANLDMLINNLSGLKMNEYEDMASYIGKIDQLANEIRGLGEPVTDRYLRARMIGGLSNKYFGFRRAWNSTSESEQTLKHLIDRLIQDENELKKKDAVRNPSNQALFVKKLDAPKRFNKRNNNRKPTEEEMKKRMETWPCKKCGQKGHWARECTSKSQIHQETPQRNDVALMAIGEKVINDSSWYADSGASAHMCGDLSVFKYYEGFDNPTSIMVGNENILQAQGKGTIAFHSQVGDEVQNIDLRNVLFVPGLAANLLSIGAATRSGGRVVFEDEQCKIYFKQTGNLVAIANQLEACSLFQLEMTPIKQTAFRMVAFMMKEKRSLEEWHKSLGHIGPNQVVKMSENHSADGMKIGKDKCDDDHSISCTDCPMGKGTHASHPSSTRPKATRVGQIVHADLIGPVSPVSLGGSKYILLFTDEYSNYRCSYMLKNKTETAQALENFICTIETETGQKLESLWSDCGSELINENIKTILNLEHVVSKNSTPYTPQQNGAAERSNRTLIEMTRTMINTSKLKLEIWAEAVKCATYILNRVTSSSKGDISPFEYWFSRTPNIAHIVEFGTEVQILAVPRRSGSKWLSKTENAVIVGHTERSNTYRCYIPETDSVRLSCDIIFRSHANIHDKTHNIDREPNPHAASADIVSCEHYQNRILSTPSLGISFNDQDSKTNGQVGSSTKSIGMLDAFENNSIDASTNNAENDGGLQLLADTAVDNAADNNLNLLADAAVEKENTANEPVSEPINNASSSTPNKHYTNDGSESAIETTLSPVPPRMPANLLEGSIGGENSNEEDECIPIAAPQSTIQTRSKSKGIRNLDLKIFNLNLCAIEAPTTYAQAMESKNRYEWKLAIEAENNSLLINDVWSYVDLPVGTRPLTGRWLFKVKTFPSGEIERFKARLVAKGFNQRDGIDVFETFASVVRYETVRLMFALKVIKQLEIIQFDVTTAFLNGLLDEDIYMAPPDGIACPIGKVLKLNKSLYGLKQSPRCWQRRFNEILARLGLKATLGDPCLYTGTYRGQEIYLVVYVDDGLALAKDKHTLSCLIQDIGKEIKIKTVETNIFVGLEIENNINGVRLHQFKYIESMLNKFNMSNCSPISTPMNNQENLNDNVGDEPMTSAPYRELVGSLNYSACVSRPDITFAVSVLSRYLHKPLDKHWTAAKRVLRYLKGTATLGISFQHTPKVNIECYSDADWAGDTAQRKSTSGILLSIGGGGIIFKSKLQSLVAMSTAEAEYTACSLATREIIWIKTLLNELKVPIANTTLHVDNQAALKLVHNPEFHSRTKHFDIRMHSIREHYKMGLFDLKYVPTKNQLADVLTKPLPSGTHKDMVTKIGMRHKLNAATFLALVAMVSVVGCNNFQIEDPVVWRTTTIGHAQGSIDLDLALTFFNPCSILFSNLTSIPATDKDLVYTCNKRYKEDILTLLEGMDLGRGRRGKRDGGVTALTVAAFSALYVSAYSHQAARVRTYKEEAKEKYEMLELLGKQVTLLQQQVIISSERMSSKMAELGDDIGVLTMVVEAQSQITSALMQALIGISKEQAFLLKLKEDIKIGGPVPEYLLKRVNISTVNAKVTLHQSTINSVRFINETLYVKVTVLKLSHDTSILKADPFSYTAVENNLICQFVYTGPEYVLYNLTSNCIKPIEKSEIIEDLIITEGCEHRSIENIKQYKSTNCHQQNENNLVKPKAQYKHHGRKLLVNCQMHTIFSGGVYRPCPNYVFSAEKDVTFLVDEFEFTFSRHSLASSGVSYMIPERINLHLGTAKTEFKSLSANEVEKLANASKAFRDKQATIELSSRKGPSLLETLQDGSDELIKSTSPYLSILLTIFILFLVFRSLCGRPPALTAVLMCSIGPSMIFCSDPKIMINLGASDATVEINALQKTMQLEKCNGWSINADCEMWSKGVGQYAVSVACGLSRMSITCPCDSSIEFIPIVSKNELHTVTNYKNPACSNSSISELHQGNVELFDVAAEYLCNYARSEDGLKEKYGQLIASACTLAKLAFNCACHGSLPHKTIYTDLLSTQTSMANPIRNAECLADEMKKKEREKTYQTSVHARFYKPGRTATI